MMNLSIRTLRYVTAQNLFLLGYVKICITAFLKFYAETLPLLLVMLDNDNISVFWYFSKLFCFPVYALYELYFQWFTIWRYVLNNPFYLSIVILHKNTMAGRVWCSTAHNMDLKINSRFVKISFDIFWPFSILKISFKYLQIWMSTFVFF